MPKRSGPGGVVAARGDLHAGVLQHSADRLDPNLAPIDHVGAMIVDVGHYLLVGRSSSAAKKAAEVFKMWLARRSSRTSRSSSASRCASLVVVPGPRRRSQPAEPSCATSPDAFRAARQPERRALLRRRVLPELHCHPSGPLTQLVEVLPGCRHDSRPPWVESFHQTRGDSVTTCAAPDDRITNPAGPDARHHSIQGLGRPSARSCPSLLSEIAGRGERELCPHQ